MLALTVIICAHNPRPAYLSRVFGALRAQTLAYNRWELLLVDNMSRRGLAEAWDLSWHPNARHIHEETLGLAFARQRGIREAATDILVFVDDDNVLAQNYLEEALKIEKEWPQLGVWGGSMVPEFEIDPPPEIVKYLPLRDVKRPEWTNVRTCWEAIPWGAGMCVRSRVGRAYQQGFERSTIQLTDRCADNLASAGDIEISYVACSLGLGFGIFPSLSLIHLMPKSRLNKAYAVRLTEGITLSLHLLAYKWAGVTPASPAAGIGLLHVAKNILSRHGFERRIYLAEQRAVYRALRMIEAIR